MQTRHRSVLNRDIPDSFDLGFCSLAILSERIAEVVIKEGVEVSGAMVERCMEVLRGALQAPFCLLVIERNAHSYDFRAQTTLGAIDDLLAVALVSEKPLMDMASCCLMRQPRPTSWPMAVFSNREDALALLNALPAAEELVPGTMKEYSLGQDIC